MCRYYLEGGGSDVTAFNHHRGFDGYVGSQHFHFDPPPDYAKNPPPEIEADVYARLAWHLAALGMGLPFRDDLVAILRENLTEDEAQVALLLPNRVAPFAVVAVDDILPKAHMSREQLESLLESLAAKHMVFTHPTPDGRPGYALHQAGYGFPQTFLWSGAETEHARKMAGMVAKYSNRQVLYEMYGATETKPYRYVPSNKAVSEEVETVYPYHTMEHVISKARRFAVAHCTCRMAAKLLGRPCDHPIEVCVKFNDLADYVIDAGLAREISREEALAIVRESEEAGLVHFVDNCKGEPVHNCNCCGDACWNVGNIRRRKVPRDLLMATYFLRRTVEDMCTGCGVCQDLCPVSAVALENGVPVIDDDWCIGCGVCVHHCPQEAAYLVLRDDKDPNIPEDFRALHQQILKERGLAT